MIGTFNKNKEIKKGMTDFDASKTSYDYYWDDSETQATRQNW